jgi:uncharacterized protein (TIGR02598 family)
MHDNDRLRVPRPVRRHPPRANAGGFSLVEVTLALGIFAFAFVAIMGLLPTGLNTADAAIRQSEVSKILTTATASIRGMRWEGGNLETGSWFGGDTLSFPAASEKVFLSEGGSITEFNNAKYEMTVDADYAGTKTKWPGQVRAAIKVSWPPGSANPLGKEQVVVFAPIPKQQGP